MDVFDSRFAHQKRTPQPEQARRTLAQALNGAPFWNATLGGASLADLRQLPSDNSGVFVNSIWTSDPLLEFRDTPACRVPKHLIQAFRPFH